MSHVNTIEEMYQGIEEVNNAVEDFMLRWGIWSESTLGHMVNRQCLDNLMSIDRQVSPEFGSLTHLDEDGFTFNHEGCSQGIRYDY